jgi:N6-L-threonylcarbamoyladenine synthase
MMIKDNYDFSFSGLKTSVRQYVEAHRPLGERETADVAASAQEAIVDALARKALACALATGVRNIYCAGGVAANGSLRDRMEISCAEHSLRFHAPPAAYCTDNGAMVACAASKHLARGLNDGLSLDVFARGVLQSWLS